MSDRDKRNTSNAVWIGLGLGILAGIATGLVVIVKQVRDKQDPLTESVEELRDRAERVLTELSVSVAQITQRAQELQTGTDPAPAVNVEIS